MKERISIQKKIIDLEVGIVTLFLLILFLLLSFISAITLENIEKRNLQSSVDRAKNYLSIDNGNLVVDKNLKGSPDSVIIMIYNKSGDIVYGRMPEDFNINLFPNLTNDVVQTKKENAVTWYVYDSYFKLDNYDYVWVRGITTGALLSNVMKFLFLMFAISIPVIVIVISATNFIFLKKFLNPITKISTFAKGIANGEDLDKRIEITDDMPEEGESVSTAINEMLESLKNSFENQKQFSANVSHELKTPLSVILSESEIALQDLESVENICSDAGPSKVENTEIEDTKEDLKNSILLIKDEAVKMNKLISQLLVLVKSDNNTLILKKEKVNISMLVDAICDEQEEAASAKNIKINKDIKDDIYVVSDETMLVRFFMNLISNAIKYGKKDGNVYVKLEQYGNGFKGYIKDDGIGIAKDNLKNIWRRFYKASNVRENDEVSFGLGLSFVNMISKKLGINISVESEINKGSTFYFECA